MSSSTSASDTSDVTETITKSNIDDIVESLYNNQDELIGYSCKQIMEKNTVEEMDLVFYMDVLSPKDDESGNSDTNYQLAAIDATQSVVLEEVALEYQIDPDISRGVRCFDLPVDGSTWLVQMSIEKKDFVEVTIFGGCRKLEWDDATQDCNFYEARLKGSYIGAVPVADDGTEFSDVVGFLKSLINGPTIVDNLNNNGDGGNGLDNIFGQNAASDAYKMAFLGVPRAETNPNFQAEEGRNDLKPPVNIKTGIDASQSTAQPNRNTITVVGGMLVACFSIAFLMVAYILVKRRQSYRNERNEDEEERRSAEISMAMASGASAGNFHLDTVDRIDRNDEYNHADDDGYGYDRNDYDDDNDGDDDDDIREDQAGGGREMDPESFRDDDAGPEMQQNHLQHESLRSAQRPQQEYGDHPMSAEAIQMDLGNTLKGQMIGLHGNTSKKVLPMCGPSTRGGNGGNQHKVQRLGSRNAGSFFHQLSDDGDHDSFDDSDSWAQTDGTIGSLELQLEPITAEV